MSSLFHNQVLCTSDYKVLKCKYSLQHQALDTRPLSNFHLYDQTERKFPLINIVCQFIVLECSVFAIMICLQEPVYVHWKK